MSSSQDKEDRELDDGEQVLRMFLMTQEAQGSRDESQCSMPRPMAAFLFPRDDAKEMEEARKTVEKFSAFLGRIGGGM